MADEVAPGPPPRPNRSTEDRISALEKRVEELTRKKSYPFSVAPDDNVLFRVAPDPSGATTPSGAPRANVEIGFGDGPLAFRTLPDPHNPVVQTAALLDHAGNVMMRTDGFTGYGLYSPVSTGVLYIMYGGSATRWDVYTPSANNVWRTIYKGSLTALNPAVYVGLNVEARSAGSTACTAALRVQYYRQGRVPLRTSKTVSVTAGANDYQQAPFSESFLLPGDMMNKNLYADVEVCLTAGANGANVASCNCEFFLGAGTFPGWETA